MKWCVWLSLVAIVCEKPTPPPSGPVSQEDTAIVEVRDTAIVVVSRPLVRWLVYRNKKVTDAQFLGADADSEYWQLTVTEVTNEMVDSSNAGSGDSSSTR